MIRYVDKEILAQVKGKLGVERLISYPMPLAFRKAQEVWGDKMFPFLNIFRESPWRWDEHTRNYATATTLQRLTLDKETRLGEAAAWLPCRATYQADFCTNYLNQANEVNGKYLLWWVFPYIVVSYEGLGLPKIEDALHGRVYFSEPVDNSLLDKYFDEGNYFRHTYKFDVIVQMLFTEKGIPVVDQVVTEVQAGNGEAEEDDRDGG